MSGIWTNDPKDQAAEAFLRARENGPKGPQTSEGYYYDMYRHYRMHGNSVKYSHKMASSNRQRQFDAYERYQEGGDEPMGFNPSSSLWD